MKRAVVLAALMMPVWLGAAPKVDKETLEAGGQKHEYFVLAPKDRTR